MINRITLLSDLQKLLQRLEADLLERSESTEVPEVGKTLRAEYDRAKTAERTAQNYEDWRTDAITQAAAAWVLSCVFVRFLEDNRLIDPPKIAGLGERLVRARDEWEFYLSKAQQPNERDYLLTVFDQLAKMPGTKDVFGEHNPIRELPNWLSGDAAKQLLDFFQRIDANIGFLVHDFTDPNWDTRFLGDLYQDLSEAARKKYALLQTPEFVEEFILDRTLNPALDEFGLDAATVLDKDGKPITEAGFRMIDPACGSGHFLLGAFPRILDRWQRKEPGTNVRELVQRALDSIHGVDVNPYAVAIARFRLLLAAMRACRVTRLADVPAFHLNLACGDSLLHSPLKTGHRVFDFDLTNGDAECEHAYQSEDLPILKRMLRGGQYHAVVANPPYITPKDRQLNERYRKRFKSCHMKYSLAVPFLERIFRLAVSGSENTGGGYTGQITANSFMKREFGKKLIEAFFPTVDLTHVLDTSGAYIPGHGTPTVILFGRNRRPLASTLRAVMGIRGEPSTPDDPAQGLVWSAVVAQVDQPASRSEFVSVGDSPRDPFHKHPWSIGGGGASELKEQIDALQAGQLSDYIADIGRSTHVGEDDVYFIPESSSRRMGLKDYVVPFVTGESVRDYQLRADHVGLFPYDRASGEPLPEIPWQMARHFWQYRELLRNRRDFGQTVEQRGLRWFDHTMFFPKRYRNAPYISSPNISSHLHFVLQPIPSLFNMTAPVIVLGPDSPRSDYYRLLAYCNSSVICFWMKQIAQQKQLTGGDGVRVESLSKVPYQFSTTQIKQIPLPDTSDSRVQILWNRLASLGERIDEAIRATDESRTLAMLNEQVDRTKQSRAAWATIGSERSRQRSRAILIQEEIDFTVYVMWNLADQKLMSEKLEWAEVTLDAGDRPFDILRGRNEDGFPVPDGIPASWPSDLKNLWQLRMDAISQSSDLRLIEDPHYKRRWIGRQGLFNHTRNKDELDTACTIWMLDRLESYFDFDGRMNDAGRPTAKLEIVLSSVAQLADVARQDAEFMRVGELFRDDAAFDVQTLIAEIVDSESVPLLPILRYKPSGLRKHGEWEQTWDLQRREDAGETVESIPVPPKFDGKDFLKSDYNRLRGKLDVPKERWISFPHCEGPDGTPVIAWAGYDHLQQARAISVYYVRVQTEFGGTDDARLIPLLACLIELIPWLKQWHNEPDAAFDGMRMGDYFEGFVSEEARQLNKTIPEIKAWSPPARTVRRGRRTTA